MIGSPVVGALSPQEQSAVEVAVRVLGARAETGSDGIVLVHPDGRQAAFVEATVGDQREFELARLRRESDLRWPAPARWWWMVKAQIPDLHWLIHTAPARLLGHADVLDQPATVLLAPGPGAGDPDTVVPALQEWLATDQAARAMARLARCRADEWHLYLTVDYTGLAPNAFDALVRADGLPGQQLQQPDISHLWVTPVFGRCVFLWSRREGWSRHEPYVRRTDRP